MPEEPGPAGENPEGDAVDMALDAALSEPSGDGDGLEQAAGGTDPLGDQAGDPDAGGDWFTELTDALTRSPTKSIREIDEADYFDPENGGRKRIMLVADDIVTNGDGLQNWMHLLIGAVEITVSEASGDSGESGSHENGDTALEETDTSGVEIA